jgi:hypothetical protein
MLNIVSLFQKKKAIQNASITAGYKIYDLSVKRNSRLRPCLSNDSAIWSEQGVAFFSLSISSSGI